MKGETLVWIMSSRVPVHIATIENFTLVPLRDGVNFSNELANTFQDPNFEHNIIEYLVDKIRFGIYEDLLKNWPGEVYVVSIIGRQSSGKSYLLNRLFGTRFNVAANRCTDGIWMSCCIIKGDSESSSKLVVVLDCEGLFSTRRNNEEEMKMCLALSSISDILIMNQDLSFNRNLTNIFENMQKIVGKLKGRNLFKGFLFLLVRDVPHSGIQQAENEFRLFIQNVYEKENNFLTQLFEGRTGCMCIVNFENDMFIEYLNELRSSYILKLDHNRWKNGKNFLSTFKIMLAQVMTNDDRDMDEYKLRMQVDKIYFACVKMLLGSDQEKSPYEYSKDFKFNISLEDISVDLLLKHDNLNIWYSSEGELESTALLEEDNDKVTLDEVQSKKGTNQANSLEFNTFQPLINIFMKKVEENNETNHNSWFSQLKKCLKLFWKERQEMTFKLLMELLEIEEIPDKFDKIKLRLGEIIKSIDSSAFLCERTCRKCDRVCVLMSDHKIDCSCLTSHICSEICEILPSCIEKGLRW